MSFFFFQAEDGIRDDLVTGVQTCALPISRDGVKSVNVHHADETIVANHKVAAAAGAEHFGAVFFKRDVPGNRGRSEERRVGKSVDLGGRRIIKKKNEVAWQEEWQYNNVKR